MRPLSILAILLAAACNRGPEPPPGPVTEAPEVPEAPSTPPGHPPTDHPPVAPAARGGASVDPANPALAGVRWQAHEPLTWRQPSSAMRAAEYVVTGEAGEATMTVFHFPGMGGSVRENIDRWVGQFRTPEGGPVEDSSIETKTIAGLEVTVLDVRGTFSDGMMGGGAPQPDTRMLGAIVAGPHGPIFFKLTGPAATVESAKGAFDELVGSFEPAG
ncbi:MAG: hypothetical protein KF901_16745 [Myxococcales bacterium]|nr:hypothetical protein [Myxococcales bacterium]